ARILKAYGDHADEVVRKNPYRLAEDIHGIGFLTADRIGRELGIQHDAPERVEAGLVHVLQQARDQGHTCAPRAEAIDAAARLLEVDEGAIEPSIDALIAQNAVVQQEHQGEPHLWLKPLFLAETTLARDLVRLLAAPGGLPPIKVGVALDWVERRRSIELARSQRDALRRCLTEKVCVITGGPGVGKTTIVASLIDIVTAKRTRVRLAAPTGRAAKRLSEATGREAVTIHRLLKWNPRTRDFEHNADEPIPEVDLLVVDEASMIDALLMHRLVAALPPRAHLVIVGDKDQLPSVGPGAILRDLIASGRVPVAELVELHRQAQGSRIVAASHEVNQGRVPELPPPEAPSDLHFVDARTPEEAVEAVCYLVLRELPRRYGFSPRKDIQVLAPMHRGVCGIKALNEALAAELDKSAPPGPILIRGDSRYRVGTKVIQLRNNYELEVYNGDVGIVTEVSKEKGELIVELDDGRRVRYERADLDQIEVAYAISIHKSQGSEYPCVVIPFLTQHYLMLQRNLLYTALTRAKKHVVIVGQRRAIRMAAENTRTVVRLTSLAERLRGQRVIPRGGDAECRVARDFSPG
ncbi:MAG: SF1B family DNA helicase RecD2, partial [Planctomycetota bacterium]